MSYDTHQRYYLIFGIIERSPDHWWVTTNTLPRDPNTLTLKGHQIIGELRPQLLQLLSLQLVLKGHQIIGELRRLNVLILDLRNLLKGHQIIGELRLITICSYGSASDWKVTRSLVSYDTTAFEAVARATIERSPDHWWVTTETIRTQQLQYKLKGHQIIGELRPLMTHYIHLQELDWKVTRSLVSYDLFVCASINATIIERSPDHWWVTTYFPSSFRSWKDWKVTRSLVSYDFNRFFSKLNSKLKGHQIIGELRR